jgi:hypothetical protein
LDIAPFSIPFPQHIRNVVQDSDVMLALVGPDWLGRRQDGTFAIRNEFDPIRIAIEVAFQANLATIPILVDGAVMPRPSDLPDSLASFAYRNAYEMASGRDFGQQLDRLIRTVDSILGVKAHIRTLPSRVSQEATGVEQIRFTSKGESDHPHPSRKILISYRRADSAGVAGRLFDRLRDRFGQDSVYMDIDSIPIGTNFQKHIEQAMQECAVFVAIVGPRWLGKRKWGWRPRIFSRSDPVYMEVRTALLKGIPIVPVLLDGAKMPERSQLPSELGNFHDFNAADLSSGRDFDAHAKRVMGAIDSILNHIPNSNTNVHS